MEDAAQRLQLGSVSDYLRHLHQEAAKVDRPPTTRKVGRVAVEYTTPRGKIIRGDSLDYLAKAKAKSVDLIMTSPPFGLVHKKSYGNEDADAYCEWFRPFAEGFHRVLKDSGSLVIEIGGAWKRGKPTRSLYHFELLDMLCREYGFHLCQEHYWWNPARLPTPAEWVNVRRIRVKDAVSCIWWLSKTAFPYANNKAVLAPYSEAMLTLLKKGYKAKRRPSGHNISTKFSKNNGGAIPPNLLAIANNESKGYYSEYCRENKIEIHPARFPQELPEYFIRFLTKPRGLVLDPFGGSCVTGAAAEALKRRWVCVEQKAEYIRGAKARFHKKATKASRRRPTRYEIFGPGTSVAK